MTSSAGCLGSSRSVALLCLLVVAPAWTSAQELPMINSHLVQEFGARGGLQLSLPTDVAVDSDGHVYVVESGQHRVAIFDAAANPLGHFGSHGKEAGELDGPVGIGLAASGAVYVADRGNHRLQVFSADGTFQRSLVPADGTGAVTPIDVAITDDGRRLFVTLNDSHRVMAATPDGKPVAIWGGEGSEAGQFLYPATIAIDAAGRVLVADVLNFRVQVFDAGGTSQITFGQLGAKPGDFVRPKGVAVDELGRIFVSDSYLGVVQVFTSEGVLAGVLSAGGEPARFEAPAGLACQDGKLYVTDMLAGKVLAFEVEVGR